MKNLDELVLEVSIPGNSCGVLHIADAAAPLAFFCRTAASRIFRVRGASTPLPAGRPADSTCNAGTDRDGGAAGTYLGCDTHMPIVAMPRRIFIMRLSDQS